MYKYIIIVALTGLLLFAAGAWLKSKDHPDSSRVKKLGIAFLLTSALMTIIKVFTANKKNP